VFRGEAHAEGFRILELVRVVPALVRDIDALAERIELALRERCKDEDAQGDAPSPRPKFVTGTISGGNLLGD
jgi:hypothetical protein